MIITPLFVFFLLLVFVLVWLFINTIDERKWLTFIVSVCVTPVIYFYLFVPLLNVFSSYHHQKHFDAVAWHQKPALRYEMSNEIITKKMCIGKTKTAIQEILGNSEWFGWNDSLKANSPDYWNYNLGIKPGAFNTQQECLELIFKNNKVSSCKQYEIKVTYDKKN